jgi:hypothetical protein
MALGTLAVVGAVNALTALSFLAVGVRLARREVEAGNRLALRAGATWWLCMGALVAMQAGEALAAVAGWTDLAASTMVRYANGLVLALGGWGLAFHVLYLRTGKNAWALRIAPYYVVVLLGYWAAIWLHPVVALVPADYELTSINDPPLEGSTLWNVVVALVGLPLIALCILYLRVSRGLTQRAQRRRARLASSGILVWVSAGVVAQVFGRALADFVTITVFGLVAAILVYLAYFPPDLLSKQDAAGPYVEVYSRLPDSELLYQRQG